MKKILFLLALLATLANAKHVKQIDETAYYDIDFSVVGTIAKATANRVIDGDNYLITLKAKAANIAAKLTKNRYENYISQGRIVDGELIPDVLVIERGDKSKQKFTVFRFNHKDKVVEVDSAELKEVHETSMDIMSMKLVTTVKDEFSASSHVNDYYAKNDIVSLFFNADHYISSMKDGQQKKLYAIGIKTDEGELMINLPKEQTLHASGKKDIFGIAVSKDIFEDDNGQLIVELDGDRFPKRAIMNNVALYGDVTSTRVYPDMARNENLHLQK